MNSILAFRSGSSYHILGSRCFIFPSGVCSWRIDSWALWLIFLLRSSKLFQLYHFKAPSNHCKVSPCVFNFSFLFVWSPFCYRSSSWRFNMMVHQRNNSFSKCSLRFFSKELKLSSSCNPECNFFLPYRWRWFYVILNNLSSCFMIHMLLRMSYFKAINLVIGIILGYISPKTVPKDCCYLWCL